MNFPWGKATRFMNFRLWLGAVFLALLFALSAAGLAEYDQASQSVRRYLSLWEEDVARARLTSQHVDFAEKVLVQVKDLHPALRRPTEATLGTWQCAWPRKIDLQLYALPAGGVEYCYDLPSLAWRGLLSPVMLMSILALAILLYWFSRREWRRRWQDERREAELRTHQELSSLARQVAHDIRGPLTALRTLQPVEFGFDAPRSQLLVQASDRIQGIAEDLLQRSQIPLRIAVPPRRLSFCEPILVIKEMQTELRARFTRHPILLSLPENVEAGLRLAVSKENLQRVISNLVQNAVEASDPGQIIMVAFRITTETLSLLVSDEGAGIPEELIEHLGRAGVTGKQNGNGLGLTHAKSVVELAGGQLLISSSQGKGTIVELRWPHQASEGQSHHSSTTNPSSSSMVRR